MKIKKYFLGLMPALLLAACTSNVLFEEKKALPPDGWTYRDTLDFRYTVADTAQLYNLYFDFVYADSFPHQNLYVRLHTLFPDGKRPVKLKSFDFFSARGQSLGQHSGHGNHLQVLLQENAFFDQPGDYVLTLEQYTRREALQGLRSVGLRVEKTGIKR